METRRTRLTVVLSRRKLAIAALLHKLVGESTRHDCALPLRWRCLEEPYAMRGEYGTPADRTSTDLVRCSIGSPEAKKVRSLANGYHPDTISRRCMLQSSPPWSASVLQSPTCTLRSICRAERIPRLPQRTARSKRCTSCPNRSCFQVPGFALLTRSVSPIGVADPCTRSCQCGRMRGRRQGILRQ